MKLKVGYFILNNSKAKSDPLACGMISMVTEKGCCHLKSPSLLRVTPEVFIQEEATLLSRHNLNEAHHWFQQI